MTDPFDKARNASAGMPGHSMSADVGVREARAQAMFEAHYGAKLGAWSAETRMYWLGRADNSANHQARSIIEAGLKALDTGRNEPLMIWRDQARNWLADEDALNAPTESVKAPEGWREALQWKLEGACAVRDALREVSLQEPYVAAEVDGHHVLTDLIDTLAASPTPITADDAVAKERERYLRALLIAAPSYQGGHSATGGAIAEALRVPFPLSMPSLRASAIDSGFMPYDLWPWLEEMEADRAAIRSLSPDAEGEGM